MHPHLWRRTYTSAGKVCTVLPILQSNDIKKRNLTGKFFQLFNQLPLEATSNGKYNFTVVESNSSLLWSSMIMRHSTPYYIQTNIDHYNTKVGCIVE